MGTTPSTPEELGQALVKAAADNKTGDVKKMVAAAAGHDVLDVVSAVLAALVWCVTKLSLHVTSLPTIPTPAPTHRQHGTCGTALCSVLW